MFSFLIVNVASGFRHAEEICCESEYSQREGAQGDIRRPEAVYKGQR